MHTIAQASKFSLVSTSAALTGILHAEALVDGAWQPGDAVLDNEQNLRHVRSNSMHAARHKAVRQVAL